MFPKNVFFLSYLEIERAEAYCLPSCRMPSRIPRNGAECWGNFGCRLWPRQRTQSQQRRHSNWKDYSRSFVALKRRFRRERQRWTFACSVIGYKLIDGFWSLKPSQLNVNYVMRLTLRPYLTINLSMRSKIRVDEISKWIRFPARVFRSSSNRGCKDDPEMSSG